MFNVRGVLVSGLAALLSVCAVIAVSSCSRRHQLQQIQGVAEGTTYHISWWSAHRVNRFALSHSIDGVLATIDKEISNYRSDSDVERFNLSRSTRWQDLPSDVIGLLAIAQRVYRASHGCYDPTVGPLFDLWGFRRGIPHVPSAKQITRVKHRIGFNHIEIDVAHDRLRKTIPQLAVDMNSLGEGYTIWRLAKLLEDYGLHNYIVEFGGDMLIKGRKPGAQKWKIAIAKPVSGTLSPDDVVTIEDRNGIAVDTSGTYERFFDVHGTSYSHILDPRTGAPVTHNLVSATVFGADPRWGDAWATAMLCMGETEGDAVAKANDIKVLFIQKSDGALVRTESPRLQRTTSVEIQHVYNGRHRGLFHAGPESGP